MGKVSTVEIKGHQYRYEYVDGKTLYRGPVGDAPALDEKDFLLAVAATERNVDTDWWPDGAKLSEQEKVGKAREVEKDIAAFLDTEGLLTNLKTKRFEIAEQTGHIWLGKDPSPDFGTGKAGDFWFTWWNYANEGNMGSSPEDKRLIRWMSNLDEGQPGRNVHIESLDFNVKKRDQSRSEIATLNRSYKKMEDVWRGLGKKNVLVDVWDDRAADPGIINASDRETFWKAHGFRRVGKVGGELIYTMVKEL